LGAAAARRQTIELGGHFSKRRMGGAIQPSEVTISTSRIDRILQYEPKDLTISAGAGLAWCELSNALARERQMIPLDPPFSDTATVGGVIAANCSGPRRRLYGTARDLVIGMKFATLAGKLVQSGGMVVKNVAGLDMSKLMIGSMGTLAALAVVNFKVIPIPAGERTFLTSYDSLQSAVEARDGILRSFLQPAAIDLLNPAAAALLGQSGFVLAINAGGIPAVLDRYGRELGSLGRMTALDGSAHASFWRAVQNFTSDFLARAADGAVVRVSSTIAQTREIIHTVATPVVARAGSGVCHAYFDSAGAAVEWLAAASGRGWKAIMEFAPERRASLNLWPKPGNDLGILEQVKHKFDPDRLLNRGRLYNRI
jgi:glycolate oxidase FAD binding subunit